MQRPPANKERREVSLHLASQQDRHYALSQEPGLVNGGLSWSSQQRGADAQHFPRQVPGAGMQALDHPRERKPSGPAGYSLTHQERSDIKGLPSSSTQNLAH